MPSADPLRSAPTDGDAEIVARALKLDTFFPEFNGELCSKVFPRSGVALYESGSLLIEQGESGRDLFVILSGLVAVTLTMGSASAEVGSLGKEALLGEMALLRDGMRTATAVATMTTRAFRLVYADMGYILQNNPELAAHLQGLAKARSA